MINNDQNLSELFFHILFEGAVAKCKKFVDCGKIWKIRQMLCSRKKLYQSETLKTQIYDIKLFKQPLTNLKYLPVSNAVKRYCKIVIDQI